MRLEDDAPDRGKCSHGRYWHVVFLDETTRHKDRPLLSVSRETLLALLLAGLAAAVSGDSGTASDPTQDGARGKVRRHRLSAVENQESKETTRKRAANLHWGEQALWGE